MPRYIEIGDFGYDTPENVTSFIKAFDAGEKVDPFSFTLPLAKGVGW